MRKVYVIQRPRSNHKFDMSAVERLGEVHIVLPGPANMHDQSRIDSDILKMRKVIRESHPNDIFVSLGGAPISLMVFGAAQRAENRKIQFGLFSRGQDEDGRRLNEGGSYRPLDVNLLA